MKIPAHLLSPAPNNSKGMQNAPAQSVADFLNEQSGASKDFFSAMKSLQSLAKQQPAAGPKAGDSRDGTSTGNNSVATKFAELKLAGQKNDGLEPQESEVDALQELMPSGDEQTAESEQWQLSRKVPAAEGRVSLAKDAQSVEASMDADGNEQAPTKLDVTRSETKSSLVQNLDQATGLAAKSVAATEVITNHSHHNQSSTALNAAAPQSVARFDTINQKLAELGPISTHRSDESVRLGTQGNFALGSIERDQRQSAELGSISNRLSNNQAKPLEPTPMPGQDVLKKGESKSDLPLTLQSQREELPLLIKPASSNASGVQQRGEVVPQSALTNLQASQALSLASAKEITAQVTRHLNSELLNMDLRTQVVAERAVGNAPNTSILTLQLHPVGLGRIQADIRKEGELLKIKLTVEARGTFELLKNDIDILKTAMRALGTAEGDVMLTQGNINRLPNDAANNGQNFFTNERDGQSELRERHEGGSGDRSGQQSADKEGVTLGRSLDPALQDSDNVVTI